MTGTMESLSTEELHNASGLFATMGWRVLGLAHAEEITAGLGPSLGSTPPNEDWPHPNLLTR
jgi:hypothetical protein